jgi:hypothetical protein
MFPVLIFYPFTLFPAERSEAGSNVKILAMRKGFAGNRDGTIRRIHNLKHYSAPLRAQYPQLLALILQAQ